MTAPLASSTRHIVLNGRVQGVGVRPAIYRLAIARGLQGTVCNSERGVEILVRGGEEQVQAFLAALPRELPAAAQMEEMQVELGHGHGELPESFQICKSSELGPVKTVVPVDRRTCDECMGEANDRTNRRFGYPFLSCTNCGPRYSTLLRMPYERENTTFAAFRCCEQCRQEGQTPTDRRFHAQTLACHHCGPQLWGKSPTGLYVTTKQPALLHAHGDQLFRVVGAMDLVAQAVNVLRTGGIVALKGLAGYQLLCRATDSAAVSRLRERKQRRAKPLAVMVASVDQASELAWLSRFEQNCLSSAVNPIVLLRRKESDNLAPQVAPGLKRIGVMLATTPLHAWLVDGVGEPLICTSGNREGDPLCSQHDDAEIRLATMVDFWLHHDREVSHPIDDSVVQMTPWGIQVLRLGRGLSPLALPKYDGEVPPCFAVGGHMKATLAWHNGAQAVLGPHVGDLDSPAIRARWLAHFQEMGALYEVEQPALVRDRHPDYFTSQACDDMAHCTSQACDDMAHCTSQACDDMAQGPHMVQHHHAHIAAVIWERSWWSREVLGFAWDGTGMGADGSIWGGETLLVQGGTFRRVARLLPFRLLGGEKAIREPWRVAAELLDVATDRRVTLMDLGINVPSLSARPDALATLRRGIGSLSTSSLGRLFDGVGCLLLAQTTSEFEGQVAMLLEDLVTQATGSYALPIAWNAGDLLWELDWRPLVRELVQDLQQGCCRHEIAGRFHAALASALLTVAHEFPDRPIALGGGVFQNRVLVQQVGAALDQTGREWWGGHDIPPNDGGLAAGQLAVYLARRSDLSMPNGNAEGRI